MLKPTISFRESHGGVLQIVQRYQEDQILQQIQYSITFLILTKKKKKYLTCNFIL